MDAEHVAKQMEQWQTVLVILKWIVGILGTLAVLGIAGFVGLLFRHVMDRRIHLDPANGYIKAMECREARAEFRQDIQDHATQATAIQQQATRQAEAMQQQWRGDLSRVHERLDSMPGEIVKLVQAGPTRPAVQT